jgi:hypothetical protein
MVIPEAIAKTKNMAKPLHVIYLDAIKAFDVVNHVSLLISIHQQGVLVAPFHDKISTSSAILKRGRNLSQSL